MQSTELAVSNDEFGESKLHPTAWWCFGDLLWCNSSLSMPIKREGASLSSCVIDKNSPWEKWNWVIRYHIGTSSQLLLVYYMWAKRKTILTTYCYILGYSPKDRNKLSLVVPCVSYLPISTFTDICWPRSERSSTSWPNVVRSTPLIPGTSPAPPLATLGVRDIGQKYNSAPNSWHRDWNSSSQSASDPDKETKSTTASKLR